MKNRQGGSERKREGVERVCSCSVFVTKFNHSTRGGAQPGTQTPPLFCCGLQLPHVYASFCPHYLRFFFFFYCYSLQRLSCDEPFTAEEQHESSAFYCFDSRLRHLLVITCSAPCPYIRITKELIEKNTYTVGKKRPSLIRKH